MLTAHPRVGYGMSFWTGEAGDFWGWRVSILIQLAPALVFFSGLPFLPESYGIPYPPFAFTTPPPFSN